MENTGIPFEDLKDINKNFKCWSDIEDEEYLELLEYLIEKNYIEILENEAIVGLEAENLLRGADFFAHFETQNNFSVYSNDKK